MKSVKRTHAFSWSRKLTALLLSLCMLVCILPTAFSEEAPLPQTEEEFAEFGPITAEDDPPPKPIDLAAAYEREFGEHASPDALTATANLSGTYYINNYYAYKFLTIGTNYAAACQVYNVTYPSSNAYLTCTISQVSSTYYSVKIKTTELGELYLANVSNTPQWKSLGTSSISSHTECWWQIGEYSPGRYYFLTYSALKVLYAGGTSNSTGYFVDYMKADETALWRLLKEYHPFASMKVVNKYPQVGDSYGLTDLGIMGLAYNYPSYPTFALDGNSYKLTTSKSSVVSVDNATHKLTVAGYGTAKITLQCKDSTISCVFYVYVINYSGTYYIKNVGSSGYMEPYGTTGYVRTNAFSGDNIQRWTVQLRSGGYYSLKNVSTGKYLSILNNSTASNASATTVSSYTGAAGQLFRIAGSDKGYCTIYPKCGESSGYVFGVGEVMGTYYAGQGRQTGGGLGRWRLLKCDDDVMLLGINNAGHDHFSWISPVMNSTYDMGFDGFNINYTDYISSSQCLKDMQSARIFVSRSHGGYSENNTCIQLYAAGTVSMLYSYQIYNFDTNSIITDLSTVNLAFFSGCDTAHDGNGGRNLVTASHKAGADTAIGFSKSIDCGPATEWCQTFFEVLAEYSNDSKKTIDDVIKTTHTRVNNNHNDTLYCSVHGLTSVVIAGSKVIPTA